MAIAMNDQKVYALVGEVFDYLLGITRYTRCFGFFMDRTEADMERQRFVNKVYDVEIPGIYTYAKYKIDEVPFRQNAKSDDRWIGNGTNYALMSEVRNYRTCNIDSSKCLAVFKDKDTAEREIKNFKHGMYDLSPAYYSATYRVEKVPSFGN